MLINTPLQVLTAAPALHSLTISNREDVADILEFLTTHKNETQQQIVTSTSLITDINSTRF